MSADDEVVGRFWERQRRWSILADQLKNGIVRWRSLVLGLSVAGALLQTLAASLPGTTIGKIVAVAGFVSLGMVPFVAIKFLQPEQVRRWLRARSVSEGLKSEIYRFRARAAPYAGADRSSQLDQKGEELQVWFSEMASELAGVTVDTKQPPGPLDAATYIAARVTNQIEKYYQPEARRNNKRAKLFRWLEVGISGLAAILGGVAAGLHLTADPNSRVGIGAWVAVLTTIGGSVVAHAAASRYQLQARTFFATKQQLEDLRGKWLRAGSPAPGEEWSQFVSACEECISAENRGWMAKLDPEEKAVAGAADDPSRKLVAGVQKP
jgi:hypothetical protein